ncbi:MAG TPA: DEAD/DEAH box helicase [Myxococcaceae bacterium]|nr:DEAD/DEAH box helicase [Myxococcaceae bacterium]
MRDMAAPQLPFQFATAADAVHPALGDFHPLVQRWFRETLGSPSEPQSRGWPRILAGEDVLIAAPTGSGKTLSAFLAALDRLLRLALENRLEDRTSVVYVSPLKALGNDVRKNLLAPLEAIYELAARDGLFPEPIRVQVRTGDTPASERAQMVRRPPHVLITTPESLYLVLTAARGRETLRHVETVIVDEIHALARDKRGSHLALSLERLKAQVRRRPQLIGLSATQKPVETFASFLTGRPEGCGVVQVGHLRRWELSLETPEDDLGAVATHEMWGQVYDRLVQLTSEHRTTLIFTNTRKLAERVAHDLGTRLGPGTVSAHHGSMARELRLAAEEKLKRGELRAMVATASLELGIDIGAVDLVVQLGSPRGIALFLQRVGRAGHSLHGVSKGILVALTRDELVECTALLRSVHEGQLDAVRMPEAPLDVLAQQIVAACAVDAWDERALFALVRRAWPYRDLGWERYAQVLQMLSEGVSERRGRMRVHLHRDRVNNVLRARKGARLTALMNGGAIPDTFTYPVVAEPDGRQVGTLDEDFAVETMAGDVFLLGSTSWRVQGLRGGVVRVEDARGAPPSVPFWRGEAPSRTDELSQEVGQLRDEVLEHPDPTAWMASLGLGTRDAEVLAEYLRASRQVLGALPSARTVIAERFFDEAGGMQLILHAPFGGRINRAWGLALRKRFCRTFDFELQAAATDDGILLSLGEQHSFPLSEIFEFLHPDTVESVLVQAVLQAPLFGTRFRWSATRALALSRYQSGGRVPPHIQRARAEDLLAAVFPAQVGCQDNHGSGEIEPPDHPLVNEALRECLTEALDVDGLKRVLQALRAGEIRTIARDLPEPSPLAHALLNSQPYTFLDDAPLEERRARAVQVRRGLPAEDAAGLGALDASAIEQVVADARPLIRDAEELHDLLLAAVLVPGEGVPTHLLAELVATGRAARLTVSLVDASGARNEVFGTSVRTSVREFVVCTERVLHARALFPDADLAPPLAALAGDAPVEREAATLAVVRARMEVAGPVTASGLSLALALSEDDVLLALHRLESEGQVLRGMFRPGSQELEWCDRRLLQRIHRLTIGRLRREIEPLSAQDFMRFLFRWHHLEPSDALGGQGGLLRAVSLLEGWEAPAAAWEQVLLPARVRGNLPELLDRACWTGDVAWGRLSLRELRPVGPRRGAEVEPTSPRTVKPGRTATLTFFRRSEIGSLLAAARWDSAAGWPEDLVESSKAVAEVLVRRGACFFPELVSGSGLSIEAVEDALWDLLGRGLVTADAVDNLRVLLSPKRRRQQRALKRGGPGRWSLLRPESSVSDDERLACMGKLLLSRWGVVFRDLVVREPLAPPWRELVRHYRRLEARGEIRGGRFLAGVGGEQFAVPEAIEVARTIRRLRPNGLRIEVAAVDPLNLTGVVTPGPRVHAVLGQKVVYVDGIPLPVDRTETEPESALAS